MSKLKIFGPAGGRTARVIWAARELDIDFERVEVDADAKAATYRQVNPNGRFPAIQDGDVVLFESLAINLYLARTYGAGSLYPSTTADEGRTFQWTLWATTELEALLIACLRERVFKPVEARDPAAAEDAVIKLQIPLTVLDQALGQFRYLLGDTFTIADLNVASVLAFAPWAEIDLSGFPDVERWLRLCQARPAALETTPAHSRLRQPDAVLAVV